ncbi:substrate import-associated zinc metallohydrolase lipoprotein [Mariniflexile fucanivorans]|uniref:Substrate import-associated zinc metallohydrolase lipoprotein n=1 Tax=Mariniflexile fucanivorans TaxID=264023 RepID=A0A4R1RQL5_9FLAO|nr:substrate import-associated zinc metallohydrolase lipoprotein [Mariniflexile fucanivorans]TCL68606.1 substrate import-associated zinc metallohydrolase lipoprotein [Mariniflexile fucanivorans]
MKKIIKYIILAIILVQFTQCTSNDSNGLYVPPSDPVITNPNDIYLYQNGGKSLFERYSTATRWRWNDNFIDPTQRATPIESDFVIPISKLVDYLWIGPYTTSSNTAENFIKELFPAELVYIGSYIFNDDGTRLLGYAEGGARVTLLNLNSLDFQNRDWLANPGGGVLATVHHEFSHIVHQNYGIPVGFNTISDTYLGNNWSNGVTRDDAIKLGMVRNYGTLNEFEDFCEIISHFLVVDQATFEADFINQEDCSTLTDADEIVNCRELNEGRKLIKQKVDLVLEFYKNNFNIDLEVVRDTLQARLNNLVTTGIIPD